MLQREILICFCYFWILEVKKDIRKLQVLLNSNFGYCISESNIASSFSLSTQVYDWVQNPYFESAGHRDNLTLKERKNFVSCIVILQ